MLTRCFLRRVAYDAGDPLLSEFVAALAKGPYNGFDAHLSVTADGIEAIRLRTIFGRPIDPNTMVTMPNKTNRRFSEILPEELPDDIGVFVRDSRLWGSPSGAYIQIASDRNGEVKVVKRGILPDSHPVMVQLASDGADPPPRPDHFPIERIVAAAIKRIQPIAQPSQASWGPDGPHLKALTEYVAELNQRSPRDKVELRKLSLRGADIDIRDLRTIVGDAREEVARELGVKLYPDVPPPIWHLYLLIAVIVSVGLIAVWRR
jgi:hypothetical protein